MLGRWQRDQFSDAMCVCFVTKFVSHGTMPRGSLLFYVYTYLSVTKAWWQVPGHPGMFHRRCRPNWNVEWSVIQTRTENKRYVIALL